MPYSVSPHYIAFASAYCFAWKFPSDFARASYKANIKKWLIKLSFFDAVFVDLGIGKIRYVMNSWTILPYDMTCFNFVLYINTVGLKISSYPSTHQVTITTSMPALRSRCRQAKLITCALSNQSEPPFWSVLLNTNILANLALPSYKWSVIQYAVCTNIFR